MHLVVISYKVCWPSDASPSGIATDGGFPFQMRALSQLFDTTRVLVPVVPPANRRGEVPIDGDALSVVPLPLPRGRDLSRKLRLPGWLARSLPILVREIARADAVHVPIPGDIGTFGILVAMSMGKPLFVRHCGLWTTQRTAAEHFWRWLLERSAGQRTVVLATGGSSQPPSARNPNIGWIFSTSMSERELRECARATAPDGRPGPRLIISCRQEGGKGTDVVIRSLELLASEFPDVSLDVVGDGSALARLRALAAACAVEERVRFHGRVDHDRVLALLRRADVFCLPTRAEGFPKSVLEALACGLPVVTTRVSVLEELIATGCGALVDHATPEAIADAVRWCVTDPQRYAELSAVARRVAASYSLERWRDTIGSTLARHWGALRASA